MRINTTPGIPKAFKALVAMADEVTKAAADAGVDAKLLELVKIRASQINGCAYCLDMHTHDALKAGDDHRRIFLLNAWRETDLYTEEERAALELTEVLTKLPQYQDVPDEIYERAVKVFNEAQYQAVVWMILTINSFNRLAVPARPKLPARNA